MHNIIKNVDFKHRLMLFFFILSVIPILLIGIFTYTIYSNTIINMAEETAADTIDIVCNDIESLCSDTSHLCSVISNDINIQRYLRMTFDSVSEQYSVDLEGSMDLTSLSTYREDIFGFYVLGENGGQYKSNYSSFIVQDEQNYSWYQEILQSTHPVWFAPHEGSFVIKSFINDRFISVGLPVVDKASGQKCGIVIADIKEEDITNKIQYGITNGSICIIDKKGSILLQSSGINATTFPDSIQRTISEYLNSESLTASQDSLIVPDDKYLIVCRQLDNTDWWITGIIEKSILTQSTRNVTLTVILLLAIVIIASVFISASISSSVSKPVNALAKLMRKVENGDLSVRAADDYAGEFGLLGQTFNHMLDQMQILMDQIITEQQTLRRYELNALQSQIKPHFLYNSLDSLTWLLRLGKTEKATEMVQALSSLFMISLSKGKEIITISDELKHVSSYLLIEKMVYSKKFEYSVECNPDLYPYQTLKLIIQPLVENAISHAQPKTRGKIFINVRIFEENDDIIISVSDSSMGIPPEKLEQIRHAITYSDKLASIQKGYGLYNVNQRIHFFCGENYGITIKSVYGEGTEVYIRIPKLKGAEQNVSSYFM